MHIQNIAAGIYDILVKECGAPESLRENFVLLFTQPSPLREYRFQGDLGFGGKFYNLDKWYVSCYREDETDERKTAINKANNSLKSFRAFAYK